jgi:hypothetical protein
VVFFIGLARPARIELTRRSRAESDERRRRRRDGRRRAAATVPTEGGDERAKLASNLSGHAIIIKGLRSASASCFV